MSLCNFRIIICILTPDGLFKNGYLLMAPSTVIPLVISFRLQANVLLIRSSTIWVSGCVLLYCSCRTFTCPSIDVASSPTASTSLYIDKNKSGRMLFLWIHRNVVCWILSDKIAFVTCNNDTFQNNTLVTSVKRSYKYALTKGFVICLQLFSSGCRDFFEWPNFCLNLFTSSMSAKGVRSNLNLRFRDPCQVCYKKKK